MLNVNLFSITRCVSVIVMGLFRGIYSPSDVNCCSEIRFFSWNSNFTFMFIRFLGFHLYLGRVNRIRLHSTVVYCVAGLIYCYGLLLVLCAFAKLRKVTIIFVISGRPFSWNNSAPTRRIFIKYDI
jgi:hypothetical protein